MTNTDHYVLIRGLAREARHWGRFIGIMQKQFPQADILAPDTPGNGKLHHLTSPRTISGMTEALRQQVQVRKSHVLVGLSMGGMIAIDWMSRYPDEIKAAVLINTSARPLSPFYHRLRWAIYPAFFKMIFRSMPQKEADILALTSNRYTYDGKILQFWEQWQQECPVSSTSAKNQLLAAVKFSITSKLRQPILIVSSLADRLVDYRCSLKLQQFLQADHVPHDTAGHDLPLDEPEWLAHEIQQWIVNQ